MHRVSAFLGLTLRSPKTETLPGAHTYRQLRVIQTNTIDLNGNPGWTMEYFEHGQSGRPTKTVHGYSKAELGVLQDDLARWKDITLSATLVPEESGAHYLSCSGMGKTTVSINDEIIFKQEGDVKDPMGFMLGGVP